MTTQHNDCNEKECQSTVTPTDNYELFLPHITANIREKVHKEGQLTDGEFKAIVSRTFSDSVAQVMRDTQLYQKDIPVDVYENVNRYTIEAPTGFMVEDIIDVVPDEFEPVDYSIHCSEINLIGCCPSEDISNAFYVRVALVPMRGTCEFDSEFLNRHYEMILNLMLSKLLAMVERMWKSLEQSRLYYTLYERLMITERHKVMMRELVSTVTRNGVNYTRFLPTLASHIYKQEVGDNAERLTIAQFKQIIASTYKIAMTSVMRDTLLYRVQIPIDLYEGVKRYPIIPPDGYVVEDVVNLLDGEYTVPANSHDDMSITLTTCPDKDINKAFYVNAVLVPLHSGNITHFDEAFVDRYADIIMEKMLQHLYGLSSRVWFNAELADYHRRNYENMLRSVRSQDQINNSLNTDSDNDYTLFLKDFSIALYNQEDMDLSRSQFNQIIETTYRNAVSTFMRDSQLYRRYIPIDLYENVKRYELVPPDGYLINDVGQFEEHKTKIPKHTHDLQNIYLTCCPTADISEAFYVQVSLTPKRGVDVCKFDSDFIQTHYDVISMAMMWKLYAMRERYWYDPNMSVKCERDYWKTVHSARRRALNGGGKIKLKIRRLSDNA